LFVRFDGFDAMDAEQVVKPLDNKNVQAGYDAGSVYVGSRECLVWRFCSRVRSGREIGEGEGVLCARAARDDRDDDDLRSSPIM
jgi:hypothetical protein